MQKYIVGENGIGYILGEDGLYYPDLRLSEGTHYPIGKYGRMRERYLKEYRTDEECYEMMERLIEQMKERQGVTEQLKAENQMLWVGMCNNIRHCAEEVVLKQIVMI